MGLIRGHMAIPFPRFLFLRASAALTSSLGAHIISSSIFTFPPAKTHSPVATIRRTRVATSITIRRTTTMSKHLPHDVVVDILSWLPVKTLIRFRCVCKSWYATITHPTFIATHLNRACIYNDSYVQYMKLGSSGKHIWCLSSDQTHENYVELELPFDYPYEEFISIGTINGLICLSCDRLDIGRIVFLWNPFIRKSKILTHSTMAPQLADPNNCAILGFGFHRQTNDYKVVRILYVCDYYRGFIEEAPPQVEVYTLSTDSWRRIEVGLPCFPFNRVSSSFLNGSVHWLASKSSKAERSDMILLFDIGLEVFREMALPNYYVDRVGRVVLSLVVLKESLSLCVCSPYEEDYWGSYSSIWVMREYGVAESWNKQFTIAVPCEIIQRPVGFIKNNRLLLETFDGLLLLSVDPENLQLMYTAIHGMEYLLSAFPYMETLVLLEEGNAPLWQENSFDGVSSKGICLRNMKLRVVRSHKKGLKEGTPKSSTIRAMVASWSKGETSSKEEIEKY